MLLPDTSGFWVEILIRSDFKGILHKILTRVLAVYQVKMGGTEGFSVIEYCRCRVNCKLKHRAELSVKVIGINLR